MNEPKARIGADLVSLKWIEVVNPSIHIGRVRHALFDFDGTISVIRRGWEAIMIPMMVEMICDGHPPPPSLETEVAEYVDHSTGILTIKQMQWLEEAVLRYGLANSPKTSREYKRIYNERLLRPVRQRLAKVDSDSGQAQQDKLMIAGAGAFLKGLYERGVTLYLASGTDHIYVKEEARAIGVATYFGTHIYGAKDDSEAHSKERVIQQILQQHYLQGEELLVVGDGPVEIRHAKDRGAVALGIAANEEQRQGLAPRKRERLLAAGADFIVTDFLHHADLIQHLVAD